MRKICLLGAPLGTANMGVTALALSCINIIKQADPKTEITFLVGGRRPGLERVELGGSHCDVKVVNHRMSPKSRLNDHLLWILLMAFTHRLVPLGPVRRRIIAGNPWLKEVDESAFVGNIHGGDSFSDIYGLTRFLAAVLPNLAVILLGKPLVLLPQTYGPYKSSMVRSFAAFVIRRSKMVLCRDKTGPEAVKRLTGARDGAGNIVFCPDVAFCLPTIPPPTRHFSGERPLIGINVNGLMFKGGYNQKNMFDLSLDYGELIKKLVEDFLGTTGADVLLIPHNVAVTGDIESDSDACHEVFASVPAEQKKRVRVLESMDSPSRIKGVIAQCDFFIGSRMHSCIAALSSGVPTVGIAYSMKFEGVFESAGTPETVVDARSLSAEEARSLTMAHFEKRQTWEARLKSGSQEVKKSIAGIFDGLLTELAAG